VTSQAVVFLQGICALGSWAIGVLFWRFWRESRDALFAYFAVGFWLLAANWMLLGLLPLAGDHRSYIYSVRLLAFGLIILGIVHKNRAR
jgi:hypothetical protein